MPEVETLSSAPVAVDLQSTILQYGIAGVALVALGFAVVYLVKYIAKRIEDNENAWKARDAEYRAHIAELQRKQESLVGGMMMEQSKTQIESNRIAEKMVSVAERTSMIAERFLDIHHAESAGESGTRRASTRLDR